MKRLYLTLFASCLLATAAGASTWTQLGTMAVPQDGGADVVAILVGPEDPDRILAGTFGEGVYLSENGGATWDLRPVGEVVTGMACIEDSIVEYYALIKSGDFFRSDDGGASWSLVPIDAGSGYVRALAVAPSDPDRIYVGRTTEIVASRDRGQSWTLPEVAPTEFAYTQSIAVAPTHPDTVYAVQTLTRVTRSFDGGQFWVVSLNAGMTLHTVRAGAPGTGDVFALGERGIRRSRDYGETWEPANLSPERNVQDLLVDPDDPGVLYASTKNGDYLSLNDGLTWREAGLQGEAIRALAMYGRTLYAGGRMRVYRREFPVREREDFDADGKVDFNDFLLFAHVYGATSQAATWDPVYDLDRDGRIGMGDFVALAERF